MEHRLWKNTPILSSSLTSGSLNNKSKWNFFVLNEDKDVKNGQTDISILVLQTNLLITTSYWLSKFTLWNFRAAKRRDKQAQQQQGQQKPVVRKLKKIRYDTQTGAKIIEEDESPILILILIMIMIMIMILTFVFFTQYNY
jgi:hypothetical protein